MWSELKGCHHDRSLFPQTFHEKKKNGATYSLYVLVHILLSVSFKNFIAMLTN